MLRVMCPWDIFEHQRRGIGQRARLTCKLNPAKGIPMCAATQPVASFESRSEYWVHEKVHARLNAAFSFALLRPMFL